MIGSNSQPRLPAVAIGLDTLQGLQTVRILAGHGIPVIALARDPHHHACRTRVCERIIYCDTHGTEMLDALEKLAAELSEGAVLFPCHDQAVALLSRNRGDLHRRYRLVLPAMDTVETLMDKDRFHQFVARHGFKVPAMHRIHQRSEVEEAAAKLRFPCILKPSRRSHSWDQQTTAKAFSAADPEALLRIYDRVKDWCQVLIVQELIPGGDEALYSCNCYFDRDGRPVASFVARKLRQWPPRMGSSCLGEEVRNDLVRDEALRLFSLCDYRGLGYVEMKRDPESGEHYLIEANVGRPTGRSAIAEAGGVDLLLAMYRDALGDPLPRGLEQHYRGIKWWDLRHDCQAALYYWRQGELTVGQWLRSIRGKKAHAVFSWSDPKPFLWDLWRVLRLALSPRERARRKASFAVGRQSDDS